MRRPENPTTSNSSQDFVGDGRAPGDVIVTGTPPFYMKPGDVVEVEVSRVGVLRKTIAVG